MNNQQAHLSLLSLFLLLCLCSFTRTAFGEESIHVVELKHQLATDLLPELKPLVGPQGVVTGSGNTLIVKTTANNWISLQPLIAQLDRPPQPLIIYVRQGSDAQIRRDLGVDNSSILSTEHKQNNQGTQSVRTLSGQSAYIQVGQSIPVPTQTDIDNFSTYSVQYKSITTGFYVTPQVMGNNVRLQISPQSQHLMPDHGQQIATSAVKTTVVIPLGQWVAIGGSDQTINQNQRDLIITTESKGNTQGTIYLKVEATE